jgi:hypothetical protein
VSLEEEGWHEVPGVLTAIQLHLPVLGRYLVIRIHHLPACHHQRTRIYVRPGESTYRSYLLLGAAYIPLYRIHVG